VFNFASVEVERGCEGHEGIAVMFLELAKIDTGLWGVVCGVGSEGRSHANLH